MDKQAWKRLCSRSSRINRPSHGGPKSCGDGTQRGQGSLLDKLAPYSNTSGRWAPTCPPPAWRTCAMLWINSFSSLTDARKSSRVPSDATGVGPSRTTGGARYRICTYDGRRSAAPSTWSATLPPAYGRCASGSHRKCSWRPKRSLGRSRRTGRRCMPKDFELTGP